MYLYIVSAGHIYFSNIYFINNLATLSLLKCENRITCIGIVKEYYVVNTLVSSTNKIDRNDKTEILWKVALNIITLTLHYI